MPPGSPDDQAQWCALLTAVPQSNFLWPTCDEIRSQNSLWSTTGLQIDLIVSLCGHVLGQPWVWLEIFSAVLHALSSMSELVGFWYMLQNKIEWSLCSTIHTMSVSSLFDHLAVIGTPSFYWSTGNFNKPCVVTEWERHLLASVASAAGATVLSTSLDLVLSKFYF